MYKYQLLEVSKVKEEMRARVKTTTKKKPLVKERMLPETEIQGHMNMQG